MSNTPTSATVASIKTDEEDSGNPDPLGELTRRLLREARHGRDAVGRQVPILPGVTSAAMAAYRSRPHQN